MEQGMSKKYKQTKIRIEKGCLIPSSNRGIIYAKGPRVVCIVVDMKSKRGEVTGSIWSSKDCIPGVMINKTEGTCHHDETTEYDTVIYFPEFKGWKLFSSVISRYTLYVCLVKGPKK